MSIVAHKYNPAELSEAELEDTFAARGHTVDYLLKALRDQVNSGTLSSFVITGPRGAGKSTLLRMVGLRIKKDDVLRGAWVPVFFPEEQFQITSLRDLLAATLKVLAGQDVQSAAAWLEKVEAEPNDEQSQQIAISGIREIARGLNRRLVLFVENLNQLFEQGLTNLEKGALRRILMIDPFMMIIGSAVHVFESLRRYDEAFFNYFGEVRLDRLSEEQVLELLALRADFDRNERFLREFPKDKPKILAIIHLSGGNPRLILMLYELLSQKQVTTVVQQLRRLVDELTPLLKDEMERLPPQQRKIVHALMEKGGTAQPTDLVAPTRLKLNTITEQLRRLRQANVLELRGGGKGQPAFYTVPDQLFSIWYQMRYLRQNRRRIELFVEVLRVWFDAEERFETIRNFQELTIGTGPGVLREAAATAELVGVPAEELATALVNRCMVSIRMDMNGAAKDDWERSLRIEKARAGTAIAAVKSLVELHWLAGRKEDAINSLDLFHQWLSTQADGDRAESIVRLLSNLAKPALKNAWPLVWRRLAQGQSPTVDEAMAFFKPVVEVLEQGDATLLSPLSPEQREFTQNILDRFNPQTDKGKD
ncbi:MAG: hypothetical protein EXR28_05545 [Betaproteobacteria bacterium]|nr:hypothetical protein [Betaproteobacteria bacterium]